MVAAAQTVVVRRGPLGWQGGSKRLIYIRKYWGGKRRQRQSSLFLTRILLENQRAPDSTAMCVGHLKVHEVVQFTQPSNALGQTISVVSFTTSPVDVPDWAKNADGQQEDGLDIKLADHGNASRTLVLASDGWIDASDFSRQPRQRSVRTGLSSVPVEVSGCPPPFARAARICAGWRKDRKVGAAGGTVCTVAPVGRQSPRPRRCRPRYAD